jgi:hypothetical protein
VAKRLPIKIPHGTPEFLPQTRISELFKISVVSLNKWRRTFDDFPEPDPNHQNRYEVLKVRQFLERHPDIGEAGNKVTGKREELMCQNIEKRNALLDRQIARAENEQISAERVLAAFTAERTINVESFRRRMLSEIPAELEGKTARDISLLLTEAFNLFLKDIQDATPRILRAARF